MKTRYVAGLLDATAVFSVSGGAVRLRLAMTSRSLYAKLASILGQDNFRKVVITKRVTVSSAAAGTPKVSKVQPCLLSCHAFFRPLLLTISCSSSPCPQTTTRLCFVAELDESQTHSALTVAAEKCVLIKHCARAALDGDLPLLQAAMKRLEPVTKPRRRNGSSSETAGANLPPPPEPIEVDRTMLTPSYLAGWADASGVAEMRRGRAAVKINFPATPSGAALRAAFAHALDTPNTEGAAMCQVQNTSLVFSGDVHPAHALNVMKGLDLLRPAFEEAAKPPPPKPRAPRPSKKRQTEGDDGDGKEEVEEETTPTKKHKVVAPAADVGPLGSDTPPSAGAGAADT